MPPKTDPYATPRARAADLILILLALLGIFVAIWTAPHAKSAATDAQSGAIPASTEKTAAR